MANGKMNGNGKPQKKRQGGNGTSRVSRQNGTRKINNNTKPAARY